jgi:P27 family predicted phage terminase small subunit
MMAPAKSTTKPPKSLGKTGRKFWESVLAAYALEDEHHCRLLENAALCLDRAAAAREQIKKDGITCTNRFGELREHPAANTERQSMTLFRQHVRELGLDLTDGPVEVRGPRRPGTRQ